jgi:hypothetical protein
MQSLCPEKNNFICEKKHIYSEFWMAWIQFVVGEGDLFSSPQHTDWPWGTASFLSSMYQGLSPWE